jgi:sugar/nucleoside kinase (ribokinase family)
MRAYDILTFGDTAIDLLISGRDVTPQFGQAEKIVADYQLELGGSCCLFAAQAAKLGRRVAVLGRVGDDEFGRLLIRKLADAGVDTQFITVDPALKTGLTVHLTPSGSSDRAMLTYEGSLSALRPAEVSDELLQAARHLHYGSLFLHTGLLPDWVHILRRAKAHGLTISLDTNWDPTEQWDSGLGEALPLVDVLLPNEQEARLIARRDTLDAALAHLRQQVKLIALKLGADGARVYADDTVLNCVPPPADAGGDSTGAGDAFDAGFLAGWLRGLPLQTCLEIACACGRGVAGKAGGYAGQLWEKDVFQSP